MEKVEDVQFYEVAFDDGSVCTNLPPSDLLVSPPGMQLRGCADPAVSPHRSTMSAPALRLSAPASRSTGAMGRSMQPSSWATTSCLPIP